MILDSTPADPSRIPLPEGHAWCVRCQVGQAFATMSAMCPSCAPDIYRAAHRSSAANAVADVRKQDALVDWFAERKRPKVLPAVRLLPKYDAA